MARHLQLSEKHDNMHLAHEGGVARFPLGREPPTLRSWLEAPAREDVNEVVDDIKSAGKAKPTGDDKEVQSHPFVSLIPC